MTDEATRRKNSRTAALAALLAAAMVGLGFAAVPLYNLFCRVTGFGGTTQRYDPVAAAETPKVLSDTVSVRFDANVSPKLPWKFYPEHPTDTVSIGARDMAIFIAQNNSPHPITGTATFNVTPDQAGKYFTKIQCFCFTQQTLKPGEQIRMPVLFFVDPKIKDDPDARDIQEITLSYTFYPVDEGKKAS
ncbi:cytochrome C oxidase assembly protein [Sphingopyxis terrae subsp. terrae NBRC 15098]|uniref:Cytochrome c oxidase assembly protein CtaG n=1 Tax=Sphingopyxis terrae subsp. terrae NBRC 15098 TaxID=1219058 RepID=A0A142W3E5_9SPHN|nr:cytochrome c oxidase assembly protein [Sphingopyxis terrae]AMU96541.1 cytochrome C oxidase assembly protein [Sphingopyxis terrae subsp. terrae NBRC 15098]